ncbi:MAG: c-type cytochrome [Bacteriovoracales bacterium]|nr:c-type cytochrome [Bacteriovoracales bacterium]
MNIVKRLTLPFLSFAHLTPVMVLLMVLLGGCDSGRFMETKIFAGGIKASSSKLNLGRRLYLEHCYACHGIDGGGNGPASKGLLPPPRNFKQGLFKFGHVMAGELPTDDDLVRILRRGLHGTAMLPWDLEKPAALAVIQYIKTFAPKVWEGEDKKLGQVMVLTKDPYGLAHKESAVRRGKEVYHLEANCQSCHRAYVSKEEFSAMNEKVNGEKIPLSDIEEDFYKLKLQESEYLYDGTERFVKTLPPDFTWHLVRSAKTVPELFLRLKAGVGGTTMPGWHETLSDEDIWAVSHYVRSLMDLKDDPKRRKAFMDGIQSGGKQK